RAASRRARSRSPDSSSVRSCACPWARPLIPGGNLRVHGGERSEGRRGADARVRGRRPRRVSAALRALRADARAPGVAAPALGGARERGRAADVLSAARGAPRLPQRRQAAALGLHDRDEPGARALPAREPAQGAGPGRGTARRAGARAAAARGAGARELAPRGDGAAAREPARGGGASLLRGAALRGGRADRGVDGGCRAGTRAPRLQAAQGAAREGARGMSEDEVDPERAAWLAAAKDAAGAEAPAADYGAL